MSPTLYSILPLALRKYLTPTACRKNPGCSVFTDAACLGCNHNTKETP